MLAIATPHMIDGLDQAAVLLKPLRIELLRQMVEPRTCPQLAAALGITMQKAWYHVKVLERAGLVERVGERKVRGLREGIYRAVASSYALSPRLTEQLGGEVKARRQVALGVIQRMAEQLLEDTARMAGTPAEATALGLSAQVELAPERRAAFLADLQQAVQDLARKHGAGENAWETETFKFMLACYREPM
jgi:predicted ArsR family transcriptional regulator